MDASMPVVTDPPISQAVISGQYLSVAGFIVLFWDHLLTFNRERQYIWSSRQTTMKWAFLINRYLTLLTLFVDVHVYSSGIIERGLTLGLCRTWTALFTVVGIISLVLQNLFVLLKIWLLWEKRGVVMVYSALLFILIAVGELSVTAINLHSVWFSIRFVDHLGCALNEKPKMLAALWILSASFSVLIFVMICVNALTRRRGSHTGLSRTLLKDGFVLTIILGGLELLNLYMILAGPASRVLVGINFFWALVTTLVSRMIINQREAQQTMEQETKTDSI